MNTLLVVACVFSLSFRKLEFSNPGVTVRSAFIYPGKIQEDESSRWVRLCKHAEQPPLFLHFSGPRSHLEEPCDLIFWRGDFPG